MPRKITQKEFPFVTTQARNSLADPPRLQDLGKLPVDVLQVSARAKKWLGAHRLRTINQIVEAILKKQLTHRCLDQQVRRELHRELTDYWKGKKYRYIFALNYLDRGVEIVLSQKKLRGTPVDRLNLSPQLSKIVAARGIGTVGQLLLQEELKWRNPRMLGNLLVNEILVALNDFLSRRAK